MLHDAIDTEPGMEYKPRSQELDCRIWDDLQGHHKHKKQLELYTVHPAKSLKRSQPFASRCGRPQLAKRLAFPPLQPRSPPVRQPPAARCSEKRQVLVGRGASAGDYGLQRIMPVANPATGACGFNTAWNGTDHGIIEKLLRVTAPHLDCFYKLYRWHFALYSSHSNCGGQFSSGRSPVQIFISKCVYIELIWSCSLPQIIPLGSSHKPVAR